MRISDWSSDVCSSDLDIVEFGSDAERGQDLDRLRPLQCEQRLIVEQIHVDRVGQMLAHMGDIVPFHRAIDDHVKAVRSEERRGGNACGSTCRYRGTRYN